MPALLAVFLVILVVFLFLRNVSATIMPSLASACTIIGTLPIAIGFDADAAARRSLGLCVVGGLIFAQFVTLYLTPVFYTYMDAFLRWRHAGERQAALEA